jgi:Fe2+ transport system protein FeoA
LTVSTPKNPVPLSSLRPGVEAEVVSVDPALALGRRLLDLGFVPGTRVRVLRAAPLGDPTAYELRGTQLCLRRGEAAQILVRTAAPA